MADPGAPRSTPYRRISWGPRILAPLALIAVVIAVLLIVSASRGGDGGVSEMAPTTPTAATEETKKADDSDEESAPKTYAVQSGDSLSAIAEKFGLSVAKLQALNPDVDPAALVEGQELKLR